VEAEGLCFRRKAVLVGGQAIDAAPVDDAVGDLEHADAQTVKRLLDMGECASERRDLICIGCMLLQPSRSALQFMRAGCELVFD